MKNHQRLFPRLCTLAALGATAILTLPSAHAQSVQSVVPGDGATDVPTDTSIVFTFDIAVEPATLAATTEGSFITGSLVWSANVDLGKMSYSWSAGNTILTCSYLGDLPGSSVISWEINPSTAFFQLVDEDTLTEAIANISGSFTTVEGNNCNPDGVPDTFGRLFFNKFITYLQSSASDPVLDPEASPLFSSIVQSPAGNGVTSASLQMPSSTMKTYTPLFTQQVLFEEFSSEAELNAAWPSGNYAVTMNRETPPATVVNFGMPPDYPPVPKVTNFAATQSVNATSDFELQWNSFTGASGNDLIGVSIDDENDSTVFQAPDLCIPIDLPNTATSIVIPADTLQANQTYTVTLSFSRVFYFSTESPSEFLTSGALIRVTRFTLNTTDGSVVPDPQLSDFGFNSEGRFAFNVGDLQTGTQYRLEYKTSLDDGPWTLLEQFSPVSTLYPVVDNSSSEITGNRFYRVIKP